MALRPGQRKCIETLDKPIVVAAGAGSGKTFTLTKRIVHALRAGYVDDIGQICAITFTNKAAAELKSRVKAELAACGLMEQSLKADDAWISTIHGMCARILRSHAVELDIDPRFAMGDEAELGRIRQAAMDGVLRQAEALAGGGDVDDDAGGAWDADRPAAPPAAAVGGADAGDGQALADVGADAVAALFHEYRARSGGFGGSTVEGMLGELVRLAGANPRGADAFELPAGGDRPAAIVQQAAGAYRELIAAAGQQKPGNRRDEWLAGAVEALQAAEEALASGHVNGADEALGLLAGFGVNRGFGTKEYKALASACAATCDTCIMRLRLAAAAPHLRTLVALARAVLARYRDGKRRAGILDNDDLLVLASRALSEHPGIAAGYADRFRLVMVDEFQDTDQMQVNMIRRIAGPGGRRLCTVGDAQQSIYRFRGADVAVYRRHLQAVRAADPDGIIELADNFRSHADVLALVDAVFARRDMFGGGFMSLAPGRDESQVVRPFAADEPRVRVVQVTRPWRGGATGEDVVAEQARQVAAAFAELRRAGHPAGDMAVLLGRMANAGVYAQALRDEGFACVVSGGSVFRDAPEAQAVLDLARVGVNDGDTQALYQVLSGPLFRVPDRDLLALATRRDARDGLPARRGLDAGMRAFARAAAWLADGAPEGAADASSAADAASASRAGREAAAPDDADIRLVRGASPQLRCASAVLGGLQRAVGRTALSRALMRAVVDSGWVARLEARGPEGLAQAANVYKAIRMVEDIEAEATAGPVGVLRSFELLFSQAKEAPGALSTEGGDFVRIMTVHASKGLEFPIVAVAEFRRPRAAADALLSLEEGGRVLLSLDLGQSRKRIGGQVDKVDAANAVYPQLVEGCADEDELKARALSAADPLTMRAALSTADALGDEEESKRLLYVALTRAREALVVAFGGTRTAKNPNGTPDSCLGPFVYALAGNDSGFAPGTTLCDFGGARPAVVRHIALEGGQADGEAGGESSPAAEGAARESDGLFAVPAPDHAPGAFRVPYADAHEGIFSYSSVAAASHGGDLLPRLSARFATSCDAAAPEAAGLAPDAPDQAAFLRRQERQDRLAAIGEEDDGSWAYLGSDCHDADKATDFGTAFHRLAQHAVEHRAPGGPLLPPPASRVRTMMRACGLDGRQWSRLDEALERWFGSDEAHEMATWPDLRAEVPFFLTVARAASPGAPGDDGAPAFLEGEIDLLALSEDGTRARVVDYKTGGRAGETADELRRKHVLQASCYAFALLRQGVRQVETSFVRVERPRADAPDQPQRVRYAFTAADAPVLERAIARAYAQAQAG